MSLSNHEMSVVISVGGGGGVIVVGVCGLLSCFSET